MKRFLICLLAAALVLSLGAACLAASQGASLSSAKGGPGQTVYLTLELQESVVASAVGLNCQFDQTLLTAQPELSSWAREGLLFSFEKGNMGVWACEEPLELQGKLCVLAFRVNDGVAFDVTQVTCTLVLKVGAEEKASYDLEAEVACQCAHEYGPWESTGNQSHVRICALCGGKNSQTHTWNSGEEETQPDGTTLLIKTCTLCKARVSMEAIKQGNEGGILPGVDTESDHTHDQTETLPDHDHTVQDSHEDHDHSAGGENPYTLWIVIAIVAVAAAAGWWFVKKKK